jgi:glutamate-1-semialdehyde 2,1-aminomutase
VTADCVRTYDIEPVYAPDPEWPSRLEFNLSNACPLECAACSGDYSSTIRERREHRPPLPRVYGDQFFEDLRKYLQRVSCCVFLGGEPFAQPECYRIWDMLALERSKAHCYVNTNGMVYNARIESLVETLRMTIAISFDGATAETVEKIRVGASFVTMLRNAKAFGRRVQKNGGDLVFNFCPMRTNWREFPDFLLMAEDHGAAAYVNTMVAPEDLSLYFLPRAQLQEVVTTLESRAEALAGRLQRTRPVIENMLEILRNKLRRVDLESLRIALARTEARWQNVERVWESSGTRRMADLVERGRRVLSDPSFPGALGVHHNRGIYPFYVERVDGSRLFDAAGVEYVDWYMGGGSIALGHRHPAVQDAIRTQLELGSNLSQPSMFEVEVAERICAMVPTAEMVAFGKNGTDVVSAAVRLARIVTGREHLLMCGYHGFQDWSWAADPGSPGIPEGYRQLVHPYPFNDLAAATKLMEHHGRNVAAIVLEPVRYVNPQPEFLHGLRALADRFGALLVFDEVVTGFRVARGGVQQVYGIRADLTCLSKALANGLPLAALAGPRRLMRHMMHASFGMTFRFDAIALAAGRATLDVFRESDITAHLCEIGELMRSGFAAAASRAGLDWRLTGHPALLWMQINGGGRLTTRGAQDLFAQICMRNGFYVRWPRILPSLAHTREDVERTVEVFGQAMRTVQHAMDRGLEEFLDGPIWGELQHPVAPARRRPARTQEAVTPFPFATAPTAVRAGGMRLSSISQDDASFVAVDGAAVVLHANAWSHALPATCSVDVLTPLKGRFVARARYAIDMLPRNCAFVRVQLCAVNSAGSEVALHHDMMFGELAWSRVEVGQQRHDLPCPYGVKQGTFVLEFAGGRVHVWHETDWADDLGAYVFDGSGPIRLAFRLCGSLAGGPARVRLLDLAIEEKGLWKSFVKWKTWSREA